MDLGLAALVADDDGAAALAAVGAVTVGALALGAAQVMYHGTRAGPFKRFLRNRPTFFSTDYPSAAQYARYPIGAAQYTPCKSPRSEPAVLEAAVDPGRILDLSDPEDVRVMAEVIVETNATARHPDRRLAPIHLLMETSMAYRDGVCTPALPYPVVARRDIRDALLARGYDSAWVTEGGWQSLAVLDARDRSRILRRLPAQPLNQ